MNDRLLENRQQGVALLAVLLILVVVTVALTQMQQASRQDLARTEARYLQQQGWAYLLGAEALARQVLTDGRLREQPRWWSTLRGEPVSYPVDDGMLRLQVEDLRTCFNLNYLSDQDSPEGSDQLASLLPWRLYLEELEQNERWHLDVRGAALLDLARDWMDSNNEALPQGAETGQYLLADPPGVAGNQVMADLSEVNWLQPRQRDRFRLLPPGICLLPDARLRLNVNTLPESRLEQLWAVLEGQVSLSLLQDWWQERPEVGYQNLDEFWAVLGSGVPDDEAWKQRVNARLMLVSDFYRLDVRMQLQGVELGFESYIYLSPQGQTRIYARRRGPVDHVRGHHDEG